ncbi:hypothetical protein DI43_08810 [Geobacillus sp. CAMR12739]|nr:hypothetical protein DI43_08810 [Geobacillus sp. CAMR12739]
MGERSINHQLSRRKTERTALNGKQNAPAFPDRESRRRLAAGADGDEYEFVVPMTGKGVFKGLSIVQKTNLFQFQYRIVGCALQVLAIKLIRFIRADLSVRPCNR